MAESQTKVAAPKRVKVRLLEDGHTHRGIVQVKNAEIEVRDDQARRLVEQKRAALV